MAWFFGRHDLIVASARGHLRRAFPSFVVEWGWEARCPSRRKPRMTDLSTVGDCGGFVFAVIALGRRNVSWSLAMIESLRKHGRFSGRVYVATNKPSAYDGIDGL